MRVFYDLETTGLNEYKHAITQIAAMCPDTGDSFEVKILFKVADADPKALEVNSYDPEVWEREAVIPREAASRFSAFLKAHACVEKTSKKGGKYKVAKLVAYNGKKFDGPWIQQWYRRLDLFLPADYKVLDPLALAEFCLPDLESHKLEVVADYFGVKKEGAHDAIVDVQMLVDVTHCLEAMIKRD